MTIADKNVFSISFFCFCIIFTILICLAPGFAKFFAIMIAIVVFFIFLGVSLDDVFTEYTITPNKVVFKKLDKHIAIEVDGILFTLTDDNRIFYKLTNENVSKLTMTIKKNFWDDVIKRILDLNDDEEPKKEPEDPAPKVDLKV